MIRDLVAKVDHVFERGLMDEDRAGRLAAAARAVRPALSRAGASDERIDAFIGTVPPDYLLWVDSEEATAHLDLIDPPPAGDEVRTDVRPGRSSGTHRVAVGAVDRLGLLFDLARTFSDQGLDVHVAKVATYGPRVVDVFYVRQEQGQKLDDPARTAELVRALTEAASGGG